MCSALVWVIYVALNPVGTAFGTSMPVSQRRAPTFTLGGAEEDTLVRVSSDKLPGHALALSLQKVWEVIQHQKDLNLPAHKVHTERPVPVCAVLSCWMLRRS